MRVKAKAATSNWLRGNVLGLVAIFIALGGTAYATHPGGANTISSGDIINGEVRNGDIGNLEVRANNIAPDSLGGGKIANQSVKNADLSTGASSSNTIADGGIQGVDVKANTLTGTQIDELALDFAVLQQRVADACPAGEAIRAVAQSGAVTCEGVGAAGSFWSLGGNSGTTGTDFLGTTDNNPFNLRVNDARALRLEPASDGTNQSPNVIGGIADNSVTAGVHSATIGGGGRNNPADPATANRVTDNRGTVGGGADNQAGNNAGTVADRPSATVGGGRGNTASGELATVAGGGDNTAGSGSRSTVGGGDDNTASGLRSTVGGGSTNIASGTNSTVAGGFFNTASGNSAAVPGGQENTAAGFASLAAGNQANANDVGAFVWADSNNLDFASTAPDQFNVRSTGGARLVSGIDGSGNPTSGLELPAGTGAWSTLVNGQPFDVRVNGARGLRIDPASDGTNQSPNVIGGSADNFVTAGAFAATIAGGGRTSSIDPATANRVTDNGGTVGGGSNNQAGDNASLVSNRPFNTVGGGRSNTASGGEATVGGGNGNTASGLRDTVGGGFFNTASSDANAFESGSTATVGGGAGNTASRDRATVGGGLSNVASGVQATVGGGSSNDATGNNATVAGGSGNTASALFNPTVGGGRDNTASGANATVPGGERNVALGDFSFAAGNRAKANHDGAFVWADSSDFNFASTADNQFTARATGGFRLISAIDPLDGGSDAGVTLAPGASAWSALSDRRAKRQLRPVSGRSVLRRLARVPISTWSYRSQDPQIRHMGPMAQEFRRAFGLGESRRRISTIDADGVALAAIKGLEAENDKLGSKLRTERRHIDRLEARLAALERDGK